TPEQVQELALDPLERVWTDVDGLRWRISMELPTRWRREVRAAGEQNGEWMWLVFRRGGVRQLVSVPAITHLGEWTHSQLCGFLDQAFGRDTNGAAVL